MWHHQAPELCLWWPSPQWLKVCFLTTWDRVAVCSHPPSHLPQKVICDSTYSNKSQSIIAQGMHVSAMGDQSDGESNVWVNLTWFMNPVLMMAFTDRCSAVGSIQSPTIVGDVSLHHPFDSFPIIWFIISRFSLTLSCLHCKQVCESYPVPRVHNTRLSFVL